MTYVINILLYSRLYIICNIYYIDIAYTKYITLELKLLQKIILP